MGEFDAGSFVEFGCTSSRGVENTKLYVNWIRLTADCREFVRPHGANVRFRFASVEEPTNSLSNLDQINRRGHSNATT